MNNDLISVVVIVYNTGQYLKDCLNSIINQSYKNLEIIIVNDGSKDNSSSIIWDYVKNDKRIKFVDRKENKGTLYTRKEGYDHSSGKYITFVDSDDMLESNMIEKMYSEIINNDCDIVKCSYSTYEKDKVVKTNPTLPRNIFYKNNFEPYFYDLLYSTIDLNVMWGMLIKREMLKDISKVDLSLIYGEDLSSNLYMFNNIEKMLIIEDKLYIYRKNNNSITYTYDKEKLIKKINDSIKTYLLLFEFVDIYGINDKGKYISYTRQKLKKYITMFLLKYCYNQSYKDFKSTAKKVIEDKKLNFLFEKDSKENRIKQNLFIRIAISLLFNNKFLIFYFYSKYIYRLTQKIFYFIKK